MNLFGLVVAAVDLILLSALKSARRSLHHSTDSSVAVGFPDLFVNLSAFYSQRGCDVGRGLVSPGTPSTELQILLFCKPT